MNGPTLRHGGCQCGGVRYELNAPVLKVYVCHCNECRKQSASAFGISAFVPRASLRVTQGTPRWWSRQAESGRVIECAFCPDCGSRLWHQRAAMADLVTVKAGSLDEPIDISDAVHIWTARKLPGVLIPTSARTHEHEPE
jgi:hypothetical protein